MAQDVIPFSLMEAKPLQSILMREKPASKLASPQQELDKHFLADCLMKSVLGRSLPGVTNLAQSQRKKQYECDVCNKSYPTFQALGGHKSVHNINKKRTRVEPPQIMEKSRKLMKLFPIHETGLSSETESGSTGSSLVEDREEGEIASSSKAPFGCDLCDKTFSTYQALGGHKSSHLYNKTSDQPTNIVKSHKRPTYLQLFPESPDLYRIGRASSSMEEPAGERDLELRL